MRLLNFNPRITISFYQEAKALRDNVIGLVTTHDEKTGKYKEQHLLNLDDIPDLISYLEGCVSSSGTKKKRRKKRNLVQQKEPLKRHVMHYISDSFGVGCAWVVPKGTYATFNKSNIQYLEWPRMLFHVDQSGKLYIYSIQDKKYYCIKNIPNVFAEGSVCLGNVNLPGKKAAEYSINEFIDSYETAFFETKFSIPLDVIDQKVRYTMNENEPLNFNEIIKRNE